MTCVGALNHSSNHLCVTWGSILKNGCSFVFAPVFMFIHLVNSLYYGISEVKDFIYKLMYVIFGISLALVLWWPKGFLSLSEACYYPEDCPEIYEATYLTALSMVYIQILAN